MHGIHGIPNGDHAFMHGVVASRSGGDLIEGAELDVSHTTPNELHRQ